MSSFRAHSAPTLLAALALLLSAFAPATTICAESMPEPDAMPCHEGMVDHGTTGSDDDAPASDAPRTMLGMPCCAISATPAPRLEVATTFVALAAVTFLGTPVRAEATPPQPVPEALPPGRTVPLHIALGRFLT